MLKCKSALLPCLLLLFLLAGCIAPAQPSITTNSQTTEDVATETALVECEEGFRLFDHELLATEPICIPIAPERVVALDMASVEMTILTNKTLVGTSNWIVNELPLLSPQFTDVLATVENVGFPPEPETILALKPDIILATSGLDIGELMSVAPVVIADEVIYTDWKLGTQFWSEVLNVPDFYTAMKENYDTRVAELQSALGQPNEIEVSIISASTYAIALWMPDTPVGNILSDVGLARPEAQSLIGEAALARYEASRYIEISEERLDLVDGDAIFYFTYAAIDPEVAQKESDFIAALEEKPLWLALGAVQADNAFFVPGYWWRSQTYLHASKVIDDLFTYLADASATTPILDRME